MPSIYLKQTTGTYENVNVKEEPYEISNLFTRYKHTFTSSIPGNIWIFNRGWHIWSFLSWENYLTITTGNQHSSAKLTEAHVYFNKYDIYNQYPLILVLLFENGQKDPKAEDKYYTRSVFKTKFSGRQSQEITGLQKYVNENNILDTLLKENDLLEHILTYDIGKTKGDTVYPSYGLYNGNKIRVTDDSQSLSHTKTPGFKKYKHELQGIHPDKKAYVIFDGNLLFRKDKRPIKIQNQKYDYINIYFSERVREPLLVEFSTNQSNVDSNRYYYYTRDTDNSLYWKKIKQGENVLDVPFGGSKSAHTQLTESDNSKLIELLKELKSHLQKTIIIMVDKTESKYEQSEFKSLFTDSEKYRIINQSINPTDKTTSPEAKCLENTGYIVYEHDFTASVSGVKDGKEKVELKFIIPNTTGVKYDKITLHKKEQHSEHNTDHLEYEPPDNKLYVYFYGSDPRPLMLCYNNKGYIPSSMNDYFKKWVFDNRVEMSECKGTNEPTLRALFHVSNILNPVDLSKIPCRDEDTCEYPIHKFKGIEIKISITKLGSNKKFCYNKYTHIPTKGFRLGNITYKTKWTVDKDNLQNCINSVTKDNPPFEAAFAIVVFYFRGDRIHSKPLLVALCKKAGDDICALYYTLEKNGAKEGRLKYKKETGAIDLSKTKYGSQLSNKLADIKAATIYINTEKRLQIILDQQQKLVQLCSLKKKKIQISNSIKPCCRPTDIELGLELLAESIFGATEMAQNIIEEGILSFTEANSLKLNINNKCQKRLPNELDPKINTRLPSYSAQVYKKSGQREPWPFNTRQIKVEEIKCEQLSKEGYKCYRHILTDITDIDEFGGLRLFLWDNRKPGEAEKQNTNECKNIKPTDKKPKNCCEIALIEVTCVESIHRTELPYDACKGDLYVYFYGSDPRPLLLCYNGQAYKPENMKEYNEKWCYVSGIESCECSDPGFESNIEKLLKTLYQVSMFLNPVRLSETIKAYDKVNPDLESVIDYLL